MNLPLHRINPFEEVLGQFPCRNLFLLEGFVKRVDGLIEKVQYNRSLCRGDPAGRPYKITCPETWAASFRETR